VPPPRPRRSSSAATSANLTILERTEAAIA
jgi:hypothetical protein